MDSSNCIQGLFATDALLPTGWASDVSISFDSEGIISDVREGDRDSGYRVASGPVIPGMINLHSHAFQRSITGKTQSFSGTEDDFWSWREAMYRSTSEIGPKELERMAYRLYADMVRNGYTTVCEFHYLHHAGDGIPYSNRAEMSLAIVRAAEQAGIRLTLLPVLYCHGGFRNEPLSSHQRRFGLDVNEYLRLLEQLRKEVPETVLGYAPHSLRAVDNDSLAMMLEHRRKSAHDRAPVHIHIAEQTAEVTQCLKSHRARPVEYLYGIAEPDATWCLIHATQTTPTEKERMARSNACVGLCPTTEADLGDGFFDLPDFLSSGGTFGIGSDSNVCVSPVEELRLLEYTQRLSLRRRNTSGDTADSGVGTVRYLQALEGGRRASGQSVGRIEAGYRADFAVLEPDSFTRSDESPDVILNAHVFSGSSLSVRETVIGGFPSTLQGSAH